MNIRRNHRQGEGGYFALSIALLVSVLSSVLVFTLHKNLARLDAESILVDDREDYAIARQLELVVHDSVQRVSGQRALYHSTSSDMHSEINARLGSVHLPPSSTLSLTQGGAVSQPPALTFFPASSAGVTRSPLSGSVESRDLPYGAFGRFVKFGYYTPTSASTQNYTFARYRAGEVETQIEVEASYYIVPLTSQRLVFYNYHSDLGGSRPKTIPDLNFLDEANGLSGVVTTQFVSSQAGGEIVDSTNATGATESVASYRHREQITEGLFYYLFKGAYLGYLKNYGGALSVNLSNLETALEAHDGLYTEEQASTPPDEPVPPPTDNRFKIDLGKFDEHQLVYFSQPVSGVVEVSLLDTGSTQTPLVIVFDGASGDGSFDVRFEEFIERPVFYVMTSSTLTFSGATTGANGVPTGAIAGAFLMDEACTIASDGASSSSAQVIYGAVLGHHTLLGQSFRGYGGHPVPVVTFPDTNYYQSLEAYSPKVLLVDTSSRLIPVSNPLALVHTP